MHPQTLDPRERTCEARAGRPAMGRPVLFTVMLTLAALVVLALLVVGPALQTGLAVAVAGAAAGLVVLAWVLAGLRL